MTGIVAPLTAPPAEGLKDSFRDVMAGVCTPVSVVTAMAGRLPHGTTVSAFASLSMDPPMMLVSLDRSSQLLAMVRKSGTFGVNVLSSSQSALALKFARKDGVGKFAEVRWDVDSGVPRLSDAGGFVACEVTALVEGGDHLVVLGLVRAADTALAPPLTYHGRGFGTHAALDDRSVVSELASESVSQRLRAAPAERSEVER